jgi:hypothetical protein
VNGRDVDDLAFASGFQPQLDEAAAAEEWSVDVGADGAVPDFGRQFRDRLAGGIHPRVVHQDVDRAEGLDSLVEQGGDLVLVAHVCLHDDRLAALGRDRRAGLLGTVAVM